jgi:hypothetical protein
MRSAIVGYDMRLRAEDYAAARWPADVRERFLLRPEIPWPLAIDTMVWPSLFTFGGADAGFRRFFTPVPTVDVRPTDIRQMHLDLWCDPAAMRRAAGSATALAVACELVAEDDRLAADRFWREALALEVRAASLPAGWRLLGHDVADQGFVSGLSNCGYGDDERAVWRRRWAGLLNEAGLFVALADAVAFRDAMDARVSEHRPFEVFALHAAPEGLPR